MTDTITPTVQSQRITMFGAQWCGDCRRSKKLLDALGVDYDYVDLEAVEDGADRAKAISGLSKIPVIAFPDNTHVVEPTDAALHAKLTALGTIS
ncbi:glutaredoxin [Cryobacterium roopkundense]|uniref:Glutaredoxin n=1 Tax=Cryobacterium roopkundense TaxID=1001240 RepID=A0A099JD04_9MICO|nr:glutaredoxin domain-containing protein [Cryobacterium roopkundense]KGJ75398.1 glutaredoxin [Cryobacterium roopkundense]MBB5639949.1 glutaredoxin [Cryobacterium roopkundense]